MNFIKNFINELASVVANKYVTNYHKFITSRMNSERRKMFDMVFALSRTIKVTPKKLAKALSQEDEVMKYADELHTEIKTILSENAKELRDQIEKSLDALAQADEVTKEVPKRIISTTKTPVKKTKKGKGKCK